MIFIRLAKNRVINLALTAEVKKVTKKSMKVRSSGPDTPAAAVMRTLKWLQVNVRRSAGVGPSLSRQEIYARIDVEGAKLRVVGKEFPAWVRAYRRGDALVAAVLLHRTFAKFVVPASVG
ncbi:hypothetical protein Fcan01_19466 [Folsomia candida]|uniref:Uncharacterized protein n=1 Tax=Folsomia candida TaxID=158441 RepID=A0A226DLM9_FOLCA|nr:hypothetical protein Fcan01_19466 [Folsomia candida]